MNTGAPGELACLLAEVDRARGHAQSHAEPWLWHTIEALARRAAAARGPTQHWLCQRLATWLQRWQQGLPQQGPGATAQAAAAPGAGQPSVSSASTCPGQQTSPLAGLLALLADDPLAPGQAGGSGLGDGRPTDHAEGPHDRRGPGDGLSAVNLLGNGEAAGQQSQGQPNRQAPGGPPAAGSSSGRPPELKTLRRFRGNFTSLRRTQRLRSALATVPAQAGPLNSQHLVQRLLTELHTRSPQLLDQQLCYLDALAWLDDATQHAAATASAGPAPTGGGGAARALRPARPRRG